VNIPNTLTLMRILSIPVLAVIFYLPYSWSNVAATVIFTLAGFTDLLDGYLARRLGQTSAFGAFLDPVADKLMVCFALVLLVQANPQPLLAIAAAIIIGREITISALREFMAELGLRAKVAVVMAGKIKTVMQMIAIGMMLFKKDFYGIPIYDIGHGLLLIAALLTIWSMFVYLRSAWPSIRPGVKP